MSVRKRKHDRLSPTPADHFTFGLWTYGNTGRDSWGDPVRPPIPFSRALPILAELGAYGVNYHDEDLLPRELSASERRQTLDEFKRTLAATGLRVPMATTNLFSDPVFKDGAFTSNNAQVRAFALQKAMRNIDVAVELGATTYVFWGGREGVEVSASKRPQEALARYREALDFLCEYVRSQKYDLRFALEAKPNEPRGDFFLPTSGHMLAFIYTLAHPEMVGLNPEVAHEVMAGLDFAHTLGQALDAGKLFHVDLNAQKPLRFDQDLRFGSEDWKGTFFIVKVLEDAAWEGMRHFDSHAYRTEDEDGVWDFAYHSMRSYKLFAEKVARWNADPRIRATLAQIASEHDAPIPGLGNRFPFSVDLAQRLKEHTFDLPRLRTLGYAYEELDQLTTEIVLGVE
jgi:xylose isomerase